MKRFRPFLFLAAALVAAVFLWLVFSGNAPTPKDSVLAVVPPVVVVSKDKTPIIESSVPPSLQEAKAEEKPPAIKLISVGSNPHAANFMASVMALTSAEVRALVDRLRFIPGNTPEAQAIMMKLTFRLDQQDFPYLLDLIDNPALADESKDNLIQVASRLSNPAVMTVLQDLIRNEGVKDDEPLFHAAVKSLVRFGSEEALASVFRRLETAKSEESTNALITLLVEHRNPAAEAYLHTLIQNSATNYYSSNTAVYMLANHPTQASKSLLQHLIKTNSTFKPAASEALAKQNFRY